MTRRPRNPQAAPPSPIDDAIFKDAQGIAGDLAQILDALRGYDSSDIYGTVWKKPDDFRPGASGKFQFIEDVPFPLDMSEICASLKSRFGGGDYRISVYANRKLVKQIEFSIYGQPVRPGQPPPAADTMKPGDLLALFMTQAAEARRENADQQRLFMDQQRDRDERMARDRAERNAQMLQVIGIVAPVALPLLLGNREKLSDLVAMINANKGGNDLKENIETLTLLKGLFANPEGAPGGGPSFDPDDIVGSISRLAGPALGAISRAVNGRGQPAAGELAPPLGDGLLHLPEPDPPLTISAPAATPAASTGNRVLDFVRPHVAYFFSARHDPALAADAIADIMARAEPPISDEDVNGLVASFTLSADWLADLAAQGLDLRADPEWANAFLAELVSVWTGADDGDDDSARAGGGAGDDADHGEPGARRVNGHGRAGPGAQANGRPAA